MKGKSFLLGSLFLALIPSGVFAINTESQITSQWQTGYCQNISVTHTGEGVISNWEIKFTLPKTTKITSLWGGKILVGQPNYTVVSESWNGKLAKNEKAQVGFCAEGIPEILFDSNNQAPTTDAGNTPSNNISLHRSEESFQIGILGNGKVETTSDWGSGYCRNITLKNTSTKNVTWKLTYFGDILPNGWGGKFVKSTGQSSITPESWNKTIPPLGTTTLGFCAQGNNRDERWSGEFTEENTPINTPQPPSTTPQPTPTPTPTPTPSPNPTPTPTPTPNPIPENPPQTQTGIIQGTGSFLFAGYYPDWGRYSSKTILGDTEKFQIVLHAFAEPRGDGTIGHASDFDPTIPIGITRKTGAKTLISLGGYTASTAFGIYAKNPQLQSKFVKEVQNFVLTHGYDGVDVDWEFPESIQEKKYLNQLILDLKKALPGKLVTLAVPIAPSYRQYDIPELARNADYLFVMSYDIEGGWNGYSGHNAPLYPSSYMPQDLSISTLIQKEFLDLGVDPKKLVLGIPLYGRKFQVAKPYDPAWYSEPVEYRNLPFDSCTRNFDSVIKVPYLSCGSSYYSYDDSESFEHKYNYAKSKNLGGVFYWAIGQDDGKVLSQVIPVINNQERLSIANKKVPKWKKLVKKSK